MRKIITEVMLIPHKPEDGILAENLTRIRIDDEGAGWYLKITGQSCDTQGEAIFLQTPEEIDQFAEVCKEMLAQEDDSKEA